MVTGAWGSVPSSQGPTQRTGQSHSTGVNFHSRHVDTAGRRGSTPGDKNLNQTKTNQSIVLKPLLQVPGKGMTLNMIFKYVIFNAKSLW